MLAADTGHSGRDHNTSGKHKLWRGIRPSLHMPKKGKFLGDAIQYPPFRLPSLSGPQAAVSGWTVQGRDRSPAEELRCLLASPGMPPEASEIWMELNPS